MHKKQKTKDTETETKDQSIVNKKGQIQYI